MSKTYVGARLRRLRHEQGLSQVALARALEISPAYLNQIEQNSRPLTVPVLLRLNATFGWDVQVFSEAEGARKVAQLRAALAAEGVEISSLEQRNLVADRPELAEALIRLHQKLGALEESAGASLAVEEAEVAGWFARHGPYLDGLDRGAEAGLSEGAMALEVARLLAREPQLGAGRPRVVVALIAALETYSARARALPYLAFYKAAEAMGYDLDLLAAEFDAPLAEIAARLVTLGRPEARGVPFFYLELDRAGHVLAQASANGFVVGRGYGGCGLWPVFDAFSATEGFARAVGEMPDGTRHLWAARRVEVTRALGYGAARRVTAIALGCETRHAARVVWGRGMAVEDARADRALGPGCRVCPRAACAQRAAPFAGAMRVAVAAVEEA